MLRQGSAISAAGIMVGLLGGEGVRRAFAAGLVGLGPLGAWWMLAAPLAVMLATLAACYVPARRAARIDQVSALRYE